MLCGDKMDMYAVCYHTKDAYAWRSDSTRSIMNTNARRNYGQMTLFNGRKVSHELMTRYFRMLRYRLEQCND